MDACNVSINAPSLLVVEGEGFPNSCRVYTSSVCVCVCVGVIVCMHVCVTVCVNVCPMLCLDS